MGLKSSLKRGLVEFTRVWGFAFPKTALILQDAQGAKVIWESFKISSSISKEDATKYTEAAEDLEVKIKAKKAGKNNQKNGQKDRPKEKKRGLDLEDYVTETELNDLKTSLTVDQGISLVTNTKTQDIILVSGQADTFFRSTKPANVYPNLTLSVFLPLLVITELWQLAIINNWPVVDWQAALIGTLGITLALHNARYAFMSSISSLYCTKKIYLAATPIYIPNLINFLALKQSKPADLKSDTIAALAAELRPLRFRVQTLMISLEEALLGLDQAKAIGERKGLTLGGHKLAGVPSYAVIIGVLVLGIIIGYFLANGLSFTPALGG